MGVNKKPFCRVVYLKKLKLNCYFCEISILIKSLANFCKCSLKFSHVLQNPTTNGQISAKMYTPNWVYPEKLICKILCLSKTFFSWINIHPCDSIPWIYQEWAHIPCGDTWKFIIHIFEWMCTANQLMVSNIIYISFTNVALDQIWSKLLLTEHNTGDLRNTSSIDWSQQT